MSVESPWLTVDEARAYARCGKRQMYHALHTGELVGTQRKRPQGTWRIHRDDLDSWMRGASPERTATKLKRVTPEPRRLRRTA
ncbi:helix-turn-helix domain-containing protein [Rhodococcus sp. Eu-32]|uniref:helix-turn-helix domain-containing protein n=1 Tax=Rhodococcus sp. Eu-32 TaxID=1017319 RepID=UPI000DF3A51F|nr:helix-turn-helix domain-containing protein [Rhodococcus sp. Eu-32]RRQ26274.1 helix-turn-helix domain-containing protein [Rhodococcus sp. Eu-32]